MSYKSNAISSDDPKAIEKLTEKLQKCEELQTLMKKANAHYKKYGTVKGCEGISDEKAENLDMSARSVHYHWEKQPFPSYHITNNGAEIRRIKKRIENLEANKNTEFVGWKFDGGEAVINEDKNRLQLLFDEKPSKEQRETLKANGFRWAPSDAAWQRQLNPNAFYAASRIDFIKPDSLEFKKDYIKIGDKYARTVFLKEYPSFLKDSIGLLIMLDNIFNRVMANRRRGKYTRVYVDEAHLYFKNPYSADFLLKCWKRFRKYGGLLTGITQNISDCLLNETARGMLSNSEFLLLLNQAPSDRKDLSELLSISDTQMSYITNAGAGRGLIKVGGSIVPFINEFPTDTELYKLMSTKPGES